MDGCYLYASYPYLCQPNALVQVQLLLLVFEPVKVCLSAAALI